MPLLFNNRLAFKQILGSSWYFIGDNLYTMDSPIKKENEKIDETISEVPVLSDAPTIDEKQALLEEDKSDPLIEDAESPAEKMQEEQTLEEQNKEDEDRALDSAEDDVAPLDQNDAIDKSPDQEKEIDATSVEDGKPDTSPDQKDEGVVGSDQENSGIPSPDPVDAADSDKEDGMIVSTKEQLSDDHQEEQLEASDHENVVDRSTEQTVDQEDSPSKSDEVTVKEEYVFDRKSDDNNENKSDEDGPCNAKSNLEQEKDAENDAGIINVKKEAEKVLADGKIEDDESDGEIVDSDKEEDVKEEVRSNSQVDYGLDDVRPEMEQLDYDEDVDELGELGDAPIPQSAEIEKKKVKQEMSDGEIESSDGEIKSDNEEKPKKLPGFCPDDYEDGEMIDPMEGPAVPREICRFFEKGNCTWADRCRFIHPGINDKGGYNLFSDEPKPGPLMHRHEPPPFDPRAPGPMHPPDMMHHPKMETAWERGLRHAKEMRRRAMQRKVQEPDFMRKREIISLNAELNVDRDLDFIAQKPLVEDSRGFNPFDAFDDDDLYAVPPPEELKRLKRFEKSHTRDTDARSPPRRPVEGHRRPESPSRRGREMFPPGHPMHREMHDHRGMERRSPPRHMGMHPHDRPPMFPRDRPPPHELPPHMRGDPGFRPDRGPRMDRDFRDRRMEDMMRERERIDQRRPMDENRLSPSQQRREVESRIVPVGQPGIPGSQFRKQQPDASSAAPPRGDNWSDPWARGRQKKVKEGRGRSSSGSSSSSSGSSRSSSFSSFSSRSSSRSSLSSSFSSSGSSRSPSPTKSTKKVLKKKKANPAKEASNGKSAKVPKAVVKAAPKKVVATQAATKAKVAKPSKPAKPPAAVPSKAKAVPVAPVVPPAPADRGRPAKKQVAKKVKPKKKKTDSSSSSEFSHSDSSASRSRSRSKSKNSSGSESGSSSSDSGSSSSGSSSSSDEDKPKKKVSKTVKGKAATKGPPKNAAPAKVAVPSKGKKDVKMTIINKPQQSATKSGESRKRPAAAISGAKPAAKKGSAIANRRVELLEQLKVVENAILKKRAKLT
nr:zinc finger CCCH domain-containing protein 18 isoform X1 [Ciona intestinalis]|eukprot:XP_026689496.1 zinc finger CCCH domain-containing protein 18 isoform X1 [Ciona intestinalis]